MRRLAKDAGDSVLGVLTKSPSACAVERDDQRVAVCERAQRRIVEMQRVDERDAFGRTRRIDGGPGTRSGSACTAEVDRLLTLERQHQQRRVPPSSGTRSSPRRAAPGVHGVRGVPNRSRPSAPPARRRRRYACLIRSVMTSGARVRIPPRVSIVVPSTCAACASCGGGSSTDANPVEVVAMPNGRIVGWARIPAAKAASSRGSATARRNRRRTRRLLAPARCSRVSSWPYSRRGHGNDPNPDAADRSERSSTPRDRDQAKVLVLVVTIRKREASQRQVVVHPSFCCR